MVTINTLAMPATNVALVHDYMTQLGGAERLAGVLAAAMPSARLYTSVHRPSEVPFEFVGNRPWRTSYLQALGSHLPLKALLPALPDAFARLDVSEAELVVSTSSAFAHHVRPAPGATHVCYCSTPAHFLWNQREYFRSRPGLQRLLSPLLGRLRRLDLEAARRADMYVANSQYTARCIHSVYGREAAVVYPPVDCGRFQPSSERSGRFLVVSRLVPTKRVELVVEAANRLGLLLDVIGRGPEFGRLKALAGSSVRILGWQPDAVVRQAMAESAGVVVAGEEDFGLVIAEAQASGRPPIAFASGGALEIVEDGVTGFLFSEQTPAAIGEALLRARCTDLDSADLRASAERFDVPVFLSEFARIVDAARRGMEAGDVDAQRPDQAVVVS